MKKNLLFLVISMNLILGTAYSQKKGNLPLTADSLATGNYKDVLTSFFQLAFNKITGPDKEIKFTSNPYAVMAKLDTNLLMDREYYKYRHLRDLNFAFSVKLDTSYKFNGFTSGVKYALINRRDETVSRAFLNMVADDHKVQELQALNTDLQQYIGTLPTMELKLKTQEQVTKFTRGEANFSQLDASLRDKIKELAKARNAEYLLSLIEEDPKFNMKKTAAQVYEDMKAYFNNRLLWTIGVTDTTYKDEFMFSNLVISSELLKGIDSMKRADVELNLKACLQFTDDTLIAGRDLKRSVFSFEPGVNFVLKTKNTLKSFFEFKLSGSYYHTFSALYKNEKKDRLTLNSTLRVRVFNDIWIPFEIKYEPKTGKVFGFLNIRANFNGVSKFARNLAP